MEKMPSNILKRKKKIPRRQSRAKEQYTERW